MQVNSILIMLEETIVSTLTAECTSLWSRIAPIIPLIGTVDDGSNNTLLNLLGMRRSQQSMLDAATYPRCSRQTGHLRMLKPTPCKREE